MPSAASVAGRSPSDFAYQRSSAPASSDGLTLDSTVSKVLRDGALQSSRFRFSLGKPSSFFCSCVRPWAKRTNSETLLWPQSMARATAHSTETCGTLRLLLRLSRSPMSAPKSDSTPASSSGSSREGRRAAASPSGRAVAHRLARQSSRRGLTHRALGRAFGT